MEYNSSKIGNRIRTLRKEKGISQEKLIAILKDDYNFGISRNTIIKIENGRKTNFSFDYLLIISEIFGCDIGYLLCEYDETTRELSEICNYVKLSQKATERLHSCKQSFTDSINSMLDGYDFWALLDKIQDYKEVYLVAKNGEMWLHDGILLEDMNEDKMQPQKAITTRDLSLFQMQELIKKIANEIAEEGVKNG